MSDKAASILTSSDDLIKEAEEHAEAQISELKDEKSRRKKSLIKIGSMLVLVALVLIFTTIAWFSMNRTVSTSGMSVSTSTLPFELASSGSAPQEYLRLFGLSDSEYGEGTQVNNTNEYRTGVEDKLIWRLESDNSDSYEVGFQPGDGGVLSFDIIPKTESEINVKCIFNVRAFVGHDKPNGTKDDPSPYTITEITTENGEAAEKEALKYINGHIVFFGTWDPTTKIYSDYIGTDGFTVKVPANAERKTVIVYWKWVNTIDQIILKTTDSPNDTPLVADDNNDDRNELIKYVKNNSNSLFSGLSTENQTLVSGLTYENAEANTSLMSALNEGYNAADQKIGINLNYFLLELTATVD